MWYIGQAEKLVIRHRHRPVRAPLTGPEKIEASRLSVKVYRNVPRAKPLRGSYSPATVYTTAPTGVDPKRRDLARARVTNAFGCEVPPFQTVGE